MIQAPPARSLLAESEWPMVFVGLAVITGVVALVSIWMSEAHSPSAKLIWTIVVVLLPIVGPIGWFVLGRDRRGRRGGNSIDRSDG